MTAAALSGWLCAAAALVLASGTLARLREQASRVARAAHELRGGLCVAQLALDASSVEGARVQLDRARRALEDLDGAVAAADELVDLGPLLEAVVAPWPQVRLREHAAGLLVRGDRAGIAQACANLVANAVEHGAPPVAVRTRRAGATVRVEVSDTGCGLPAPVAVLVDSARGSRGRRGHGLAVAAAVAERHGGRLGCAPGEGATVVLELPSEPEDSGVAA